VLAGLDDLKVCTGYQLDGEEIDTVPTTERRGALRAGVRDPRHVGVVRLGRGRWGLRRALPEGPREYLEFVADEIDTPIYAVGVGPDREETVELTNPFDDE